MIPNDQPARQQMIERMLTVANDNLDKLTEWESEFIDSSTGQFRFKGNLSDRQCEILERIYDKI